MLAQSCLSGRVGSGGQLSAHTVVVALDRRVELALDRKVRVHWQRTGRLEVLKNDVWLGQKKLVAEEISNLLQVDLVELMVLERGLEAAQALEDRDDLALRVPESDGRVLAWLERLSCRLCSLAIYAWFFGKGR